MFMQHLKMIKLRIFFIDIIYNNISISVGLMKKLSINSLGLSKYKVTSQPILLRNAKIKGIFFQQSSS